MVSTGTKLLLLLNFIAVAYGSFEEGFSEKDGAFYKHDAVVINAAVTRTKRDLTNNTRNGKQFVLLHPKQATDNEAFGLECETTLGKRGTCKRFRDCYPLLKVSDVDGWDGWVMGHYDTCSYISGDNMEVFGVCCTDAPDTPPQQEADVQRLGAYPAVRPVQVPPLQYPGDATCYPNISKETLHTVGLERPIKGVYVGRYSANLLSALSPWTLNNNFVGIRQIPAQWPPTIPPLPTHPPDHTAATHPPALGIHTTNRPMTYPTTRATTKQSWVSVYPTRPSAVPAKPVTPTQSTVADGSCGIKNGAQTYGLQDEERIVGGHNADLNEWPWIVGLFNNGRQFCGGSLIDDIHVLSAAHCVAHMTSWDVARLTARLGDHNIRSNVETQHTERKIKRVVRHRGFDMRTLYNDIAILTLDQPVKFSKIIRPVCLPGSTRGYSGLIATVIGWGSLRESGPQPSVLQEVSIPIWTNQECKLKYGAAAPGGIVEHMLCAGRESMDSCSGDSGGPLMVNDGGRWTQVGVVSWGIGCGKGHYPGVYTRVTSFLPWIQKNSK